MNEAADKRAVYRVQGFSCANCAAKFEKNVKKISTVRDAKVNFGASKLTVIGEASIEQLEEAGAFEGLKVYPESERRTVESQPFWSRKAAAITLISALLLAAGWLLGMRFGEHSAVSTLAYAASIAIGGHSLFIKGLRSLVKLNFNMNTLMTVAIAGAAAIGEWVEGAVVVILFAISEALESYSMERARRSIRALMDLAPKEALVRRDGKELVVPVEDVDIGDIMIVKPGQKIAMDGNVVSGVSAVNQAAITGESIPVEKAAGDRVFAGTLNGEGVLEVEVTRRAEDTTISRIIHLVEEAQAEKAPSQAFVDRFAKYYTPAIMAAAIGVAVIPPWFGGNWETWIYRGLALLVVGCPCALVISTPVSFVTAIGNAARNGVLIKGGIYLEQAADIHTIAFDKTGTLTKGMPEVTDFIRLDGPGERELLGMAAAIERMSHHPLASAIVRKAEAEGIAPEQFQAEHVRSVTGKGAAAVVNGAPYRIGSPAMWTESVPNAVNEGLQREIQRLEQQGKTVMLFGREDAVLAVIAAADEVRESGIRVVRELKRLGVAKTVMLTGDNRVASGAIGSRIGVDETRAELMPEDKLTAVRALKAEGRTAMVGDGVNDAPALAAADVGIAMGGAGSDSALETADIALMGDDLSKLPYTIRLARRTLAVIRQNIAFSLGIKALALALIAPGWLTLWMAIFADMGATLIVTLNALRLVRTR